MSETVNNHMEKEQIRKSYMILGIGAFTIFVIAHAIGKGKGYKLGFNAGLEAGEANVMKMYLGKIFGGAR